MMAEYSKLDSCKNDDDSMKKIVYRQRDLWSCQNTFLLMALLGVALGYSMRGNLSVTMTSISKLPNGSKTFENDEFSCPYEEPVNISLDQNKDGEFIMPRTQRGLTLASCILGLAISNIVGGFAADKYGGKLVMGLGVFVSSILTIATPFVLRFSVEVFICVRFIMGITEGIVLPGVYQMIGSWSLPEERSRASGAIYSGCYIGMVTILAISGEVTKSSYLGGWPTIFYLSGGFGVIWSIFWFSLIHDTPRKHPRISAWELQKLLPSSITKNNRPKCIPFKSIFSSKPFFGAVVMNCAANFCFYLLFIELPSYFSQVQHMEVRKNGLLSSLPYVVTWMLVIMFSRLMTKLSSENRISLINVRKLGTSIAGYGPAICFILLCFVGCDQDLALVVLIFTVGLTAGQYSGFFCSFMDLAPRYSGLLYGISSSFSNTVAFSSTIIVENLVDHYSPAQGWKYVFILTSILYVFSTTIYLVTIEAECQPWNNESSDCDLEQEADRLIDSACLNEDDVK